MGINGEKRYTQMSGIAIPSQTPKNPFLILFNALKTELKEKSKKKPNNKRQKKERQRMRSDIKALKKFLNGGAE